MKKSILKHTECKIACGIGILTKLKYIVTLPCPYLSSPTILYAIPIWGSTYKTYLQKKAVKTITHTDWKSSPNPSYHSLYPKIRPTL